MKVSTKAFWNTVTTKNLLTVSDEAVTAALLVVFDNQTAVEQATETTVVDNGVGFGGADAEFGTSLAKQLIAGRTLSAKQMVYARRIALRYWSQFASDLNTERGLLGLPTEAPKLPKGAKKAAVADRFTWQPGDLKATGERIYDEPLFEDEQPQAAVVEPELFEGDELPEYGNLKDIIAQGKLSKDWDSIVTCKEFRLYVAAVDAEAEAWLELVSAAHGGASWGTTVPLLSRAYKLAEDERKRVITMLGMDACECYAATWNKQYGSGINAGEQWVKSAAYTKWLAGRVEVKVTQEVTA